MSIKIIEDRNVWNKFVNENPYSLLFHNWDFLKIIEKHSGFKLLPYGIYKGDELIAILPIFSKRINGLKFITSHPPKTGATNVGFLINSFFFNQKQRKKENFLNTIVGEINQEIARISPNYISISMESNFIDIRPFKWDGYGIDINYTYVINLRKSVDDIWNEFDNTCRKEIKSTEKFDLLLQQTDDIKTFYTIMRNRYSEQGLSDSFISEEYFKDILSTFPENVKIYFLYNNDKIINLKANCEYKNRFMFWQGAVNLDKNIHSNEYLTWEFIKKAKNEGFNEFELSGANTKRLCLFKSKFNPSLEYYYVINKKDILGKLAEYIYFNLIRRL